jgi:hypothetical protein
LRFIGFDVAEPDREMGVGEQAADERQLSGGSCAPGANSPEHLEMARTAFLIIDESVDADNNNFWLIRREVPVRQAATGAAARRV